MITERDLQEAIAECQGERNPNANTCIKLAAFYTIRQHLYGDNAETPVRSGYSYSAAPEITEKMIDNGGIDTVGDYGDSEFLQAVKGKPPSEVWAIMDELMDTLRMINGRVYESIMRKIQS